MLLMVCLVRVVMLLLLLLFRIIHMGMFRGVMRYGFGVGESRRGGGSACFDIADLRCQASYNDKHCFAFTRITKTRIVNE